jgi:Sec-independent protein secretion pathway component TatC
MKDKNPKKTFLLLAVVAFVFTLLGFSLAFFVRLNSVEENFSSFTTPNQQVSSYSLNDTELARKID